MAVRVAVTVGVVVTVFVGVIDGVSVGVRVTVGVTVGVGVGMQLSINPPYSSEKLSTGLIISANILDGLLPEFTAKDLPVVEIGN